MKTAAVSVLFTGILCFSCQIRAQQIPAQAAPLPAACGADRPEFIVQKDRSTASVTQPPAGKALVYIIEEMPLAPSTNVSVGVDGRWIGATRHHSYMSFMLDSGVHHLCAQYNGVFGEHGDTILRRLEVQSGHIYYLLYRGILSGSSEVAFLTEVDEDEASYLLHSSDHVSSKLQKDSGF